MSSVSTTFRIALKSCLPLVKTSNKTSLFVANQTSKMFYHQSMMMKNQASKKEEKKKTAAVILSGCGFMDGSDVVESVSLIVELTRKGIVPRFFSPHEEIDESYNYITKQIDSSEERYMHKESARITREKVLSIDQLRADQFDMLVIPGGNGVVRNLSNFEQEEYNVNEVEINSHVEKAILDFFKQKKPIGLMSNSVILGAKTLGKVSGKTGNGIAVALGKTLDRVFVETLMTKYGNELSQETGDADIVCIDSSHRIASVASVTAAGTVQPNEIHSAAKNLIEELIDLTKREE